MDEHFSLQQFRRAVAKFRDYGDRLCAAESTNFVSALKLFVDFCESDPIISALTRQLKEDSSPDFESWYQDMTQMGPRLSCVDLPSTQKDRLPLLYKLLLRLRRERSSPIKIAYAILRVRDASS